ncbi:terminase [soil metagenome]
MKDILRDLAKLEQRGTTGDVASLIVASRNPANQRPRRTRALLEQWAKGDDLVARIARADMRLMRYGDSTEAITSTEGEIARMQGELFAAPLAWTMWSFDWGMDPAMRVVMLPEAYRLSFDSEYGPDAWACELLETIGREERNRAFDGQHAVPAIRVAVASGHGAGKSALTAWLCSFIMSTRPNARGVVTASTSPQLESKSWAAVASWSKRSMTGHWFDVSTGRGSMKMTYIGRAESWACYAQTSREENSESFAGLHAADSTPFYLVDESSGVPDKIFEVMEGGLTDGAPIQVLMGNPTRTGNFFANAFTTMKHHFIRRQIDSRDVQITNKETLQGWIDDYGIDSDFVKVRVRGIFPAQSSLQFISRDLVDAAMLRDVHVEPGTVAIIGVDVARYGDDSSVIRVRVGRDARSFPPIRLKGADTMTVAATVSEHYNFLKRAGYSVVIMVDGGGVGGGVVDRLRQLQHVVVEIQFGSKANDPKRYANKRAELYGEMRDWLASGALPRDESLAAEMCAIEYGFTASGDAILLEKKSVLKARTGASPDDADALAITFGAPVALPNMVDSIRDQYLKEAAQRGEHGYMGWAPRESIEDKQASTYGNYDPMEQMQIEMRRGR